VQTGKRVSVPRNHAGSAAARANVGATEAGWRTYQKVLKRTVRGRVNRLRILAS
jgi:hypothetical protein